MADQPQPVSNQLYIEISEEVAEGHSALQFTVEPNTDKLLSVVNLVPDDGRGRTFFLNPAVPDSRYDPATQTIYGAYEMTQNGRPNQFIYDALVYKAVR